MKVSAWLSTASATWFYLNTGHWSATLWQHRVTSTTSLKPACWSSGSARRPTGNRLRSAWTAVSTTASKTTTTADTPSVTSSWTTIFVNSGHNSISPVCSMYMSLHHMLRWFYREISLIFIACVHAKLGRTQYFYRYINSVCLSVCHAVARQYTRLYMYLITKVPLENCFAKFDVL